MTNSRIPLNASHRFVVLKELGRGGAGVVFLAQDRVSNRRVVIKTLAQGVTELARCRFEREALALAKVRHTAVVPIYDFSSGDPPYIVMAEVQGCDLKNWLKDQQFPPSEDWVRSFFAELLEALIACHMAGVVHRDIKPANILVRNDGGRPVLIDFGLVQQQQIDASSLDALTQSCASIGTPGFMSPEQFDRGLFGEMGPASDVWGFGATLFFAATGRPPYVGGPAEIFMALAAGDPPQLRELWPECPDWIDELVGRCLKRSSADRAQPSELKALFAASDDSEGLPTVDPRVTPSLRKRVTFIFGATLGILALLILLLTQSPSPPLETTAPNDRRKQASVEAFGGSNTEAKRDQPRAPEELRPKRLKRILATGTFPLRRVRKPISIEPEPGAKVTINNGQKLLLVTMKKATDVARIRGLKFLQEEQNRGLIWVKRGRLELVDCDFETQGQGIFVGSDSASEASLILENCRFSLRAAARHALVIHKGCQAIVKDCELDDLRFLGGPTVPEWYPGVRLGGNQMILNSGGKLRIEGSVIKLNQYNAIACDRLGTVKIQNSQISVKNPNCEGMTVNNGTLEIDRLTINSGHRFLRADKKARVEIRDMVVRADFPAPSERRAHRQFVLGGGATLSWRGGSIDKLKNTCVKVIENARVELMGVELTGPLGISLDSGGRVSIDGVEQADNH